MGERASRHRLVGLISGTSMDGIDAAAIELTDPPLLVELRAFLTVPYPPEVRARLLALCHGEEGRAIEAARLDMVLGTLFAEAALQAIEAAGWRPADVTAIGSHGQTTVSEMGEETIDGRRAYATLQIGNPAAIAEATGIVVASGFRGRDIAAGGRGAPLVPYVDYLLYRRPGRALALLNLGGIANLTLLPASGDPAAVLGFDCGPANMPLDAAVRLASDGARSYDRDGALAAAGVVDRVLLARLLAHPFLALPPPKATGSEAFGEPFVADLRREYPHLGLEDLLATLVEWAALSVADAVHRFAPAGDLPEAVLVGGGGLHNRTLLARLRAALDPIPLQPVDNAGGHADAKEAVAFAVLAYLTLRGRPGTLPSATGARHPVVLGNITPGAGDWDLLAASQADDAVR